jgi:predicted protein tyrosine phosphatase
MAAPGGEREKLLFICTYNLSRSRTAEVLLIRSATYEARSAGIHVDARVRVTADLISWADRILVMEEHHAEFIRTSFPQLLMDKPLITLEIPDDYPPMAGELIAVLRERLAAHLRLGDEVDR